MLIKYDQVRNKESKGKNPGPVTRTLAEALEKVSAVRKSLLESDGSTDPDLRRFSEKFSKVANEDSDCNSFKYGGDLGRFVRVKMHPQFSDAAFALDVNELSGIIYSPSGLHVILRTE